MMRDGMNRVDTDWMGLRQVTQYANISERTLRSWISSPVDSLPAVRLAGKILVRRSDLDTWLSRHRVKPLAELDLDAIVKDVLQVVVRGR